MDLRFLHKRLQLHRIRLGEQSIMVGLAVIVGIAGGFGAVAFRHLINLFQRLAYGDHTELLHLVQTLPWYAKFWVPAAGGIIVSTMVYFWAREAKGHGVPEVMEAVALKGGIIRKRLVLVKSLASAICIGTGGSVGREGPIVQIGSAIGSTIGQLLKVSGDRMRTLVGCGAAAGIAATFNAPIAGAMFSLEIILGDFAVATFSPIVISSVVATAISRHFLGDFPAFIVPAYELVSAWEFPFYVTLGILCGAVGVVFTRVLYLIEDGFDRIPIPEILKGLLGGLILGVTALVFPHILGVGYGTIDMTLAQQIPISILLLLILVKIMATSVTIGSGGSGGIFAPSLFLGAVTGGFLGTIIHQQFPGITASPGAYAIVGMGAVVSATTQGPITAILMLFEMTGEYRIILPLMVACIVSCLTGRRLLKESIYTLKLVRRGVDIRAGKEVNILKALSVEEVMNRRVETIPEGLSLGGLSEKISKSKYNSFPILDTNGRITGILSFIDYQSALFDEDLKDLVVAKDIASADVVTVTTADNLFQALEIITRGDFSILPVVDPDDPGRLLGVLSRRDIIRTYNKAVMQHSLASEADSR
ncbi:MAG: CBS domain-containing protein [Desulfobacteraceae bacterium]|nr:CBS domain-containing protein [Desulfobacteraceae bacterium]